MRTLELHFSTHSDGTVHGRLISRFRSSRVLNLLDYIHAVYNTTKDHMFVVQERSRDGSDEELASISVWSRVSHAQQSWLVVLECETFVCELGGAVNVRRTRTIAVQKVASLDHEIFDLYLGVNT